jgi:ribosomal protein S9
VESVEEFGGTGRRKRAVARVKIQLGQGVITVNRRPLD